MPTSARVRGLVGSALFVLLAAGAFTGARLVSPGEGESLVLQGEPFGEPCRYLASTGNACPACGMTRSWVWAARGQLLRAIHYSPAGFFLLAGIGLLGLRGAVRLARRDPDLLRLPWQVLVGGAGSLLVLWQGVWLLRLQGFLPLP